MRLNLGCWNRPIAHFTNVDIRSDTQADLIDDVSKLEKIDNNSVEIIYASHLLEHFKRFEIPSILKRWYEVLRSDGLLYVSVPDMAAVMEHYVYHRDITKLMNFIYGSSKHPYDYHYHGWDEKTLAKDMINAGFKNVQLFDRWSIPWLKSVDDHSAAYLPDFDRKNGRLMSLNIVGSK